MATPETYIVLDKHLTIPVSGIEVHPWQSTNWQDVECPYTRGERGWWATVRGDRRLMSGVGLPTLRGLGNAEQGWMNLRLVKDGKVLKEEKALVDSVSQVSPDKDLPVFEIGFIGQVERFQEER